MNAKLTSLHLGQHSVGHLGCGLFFFMQGLCASTWASRIPALAAQLNLSDVTLGWVLLGAPLSSMAAMPLAGLVVARFGSRTVLRVSALYQALAVCAIGWACCVPMLLFALLAYGVANTLVQIAVNAQAVASEEQSKQSWMATYHGLWSIGGFAGAAMAAGLIALGVGPKHHVSVMLGSVLVLYACGYRRLLPDETHRFMTLRAVARPERALIHIGLLAFAAMFCETAMFDWSGMYLHRVGHLVPEAAGIAYAAMMAAMAIGRFGADVAVARFGLNTTLRTGATLTAFGLGCAMFWPTALITSLSFVLVGLGLSPLVPLLMGAVGRATKMPTSVALAWASAIGFTGAMAAPPTLGLLSSLVGLRLAFVVPGLLAMGLAIRLRGRRLAAPPVAQHSAIG